MERLRRIANLWNWLPAFRAVAETEHLLRAAEMLGTSAPALSRTIRLLEDSIDAPLFHRNGGKHLELTDLGHLLAAATRDGMRGVDEALAAAAPDVKLAGPLRVSSEGRLTTMFLVAALMKLRRGHPDLVPHILCTTASEECPRLLRGDLDVAVVFHPTPHAAIIVEKLGYASNGLYCGEGHPLFRVDAPTLADVVKHPFVAPEPAAPSADNWPPEHQRRIALYSATLDAEVEACASGELLAVLPELLVPSFASGSTLRRLPLDVVPHSAIYAMKRAPIVDRPGRAEALLQELRQAVQGKLELSDRHRHAPQMPEPQETPPSVLLP